MLLCCATILAIIQYCNFCQLSFWMRSVLATATGVALLLLLYSPLHGYTGALLICMYTQNRECKYAEHIWKLTKAQVFIYTHTATLFTVCTHLTLQSGLSLVILPEPLSSNK